MNKNIKVIIPVLLLFTVIISCAFAILIDNDGKVNTFTAGGVKIGLRENFDYNGDGTAEYYDEDTDKPDTAEDILSGVSYIKEPWVINLGDSDAWCWILVGIPKNTSQGELFSYINSAGENKPNSTWNYCGSVDKDEIDGDENHNYYLFAYYGNDSSMTNVSSMQETEALFNKVKFMPNSSTSTLNDTVTHVNGVVNNVDSNNGVEGEFDIIINAYACQSLNDDNISTIKEKLNIETEPTAYQIWKTIF